MCCCHPFHAEQGLGEGNGCLPTTPQCEAASSRRKKLGVSVQDMVGEFCKHVCVRLAFRMVSGADLGRLRRHSIAMGAAHYELQWGKLLWTHLWINHMYFFAKKWRTLSKFSCFALEGSHRRLKRMLRNSGGLSLLRGRLGVQVVVDNHTIDDSLWSHGWDATKRAQNGQGPMSVQRYASRTRRRLLTDMQHLQTLERRFRCRKKRS